MKIPLLRRIVRLRKLICKTRFIPQTHINFITIYIYIYIFVGSFSSILLHKLGSSIIKASYDLLRSIQLDIMTPIEELKVYFAYVYEERLRKEELAKLLTWGSENPGEAERYIGLYAIILVTTIVFFLRRYRWRRKQRKDLEKEVRAARRTISTLQEKIISLKALEALEANGQLQGKDKRKYASGWMGPLI